MLQIHRSKRLIEKCLMGLMIDYQRLKKRLHTIPWHTLAVEQLFQTLDTTLAGLSKEEIAERQHIFGINTLPEQKPPTIFKIFLRQFLSPLIYVLLIAGLISLVIGDLKDAVFIFAVILINALVGTFQEWKAERTAADLQHIFKVFAQVKRQDTVQEIEAEQLVIGDIVALESGAIVPADLRLLDANNLSIDESLLTGESTASLKHFLQMPVEDVPVGDRGNMAYAGSITMTGRGTGVVVGVGLQTEVGQIAKAVNLGVATKTPLILRMEKFSKHVVWLFIASCVVLASIALFKGIPAAEVFFIIIALAVSAIPEGLPVALTVALSVASRRMAKRNVIVRKLTAVEGLGSCTCIASDKTGTLTLNKQTIKGVVLANQQSFQVSGAGYAGEGNISSQDGEQITDAEQQLLLELAKASALCNEASLIPKDGQWKPHGDAVDLAFLAFAYKAGLDVDAYRNQAELLLKIPYESEKRYAAVLYREQGQLLGVFKGATDTILPLCDSSGFDRPAMEESILALTQEGHRVIAVAKGKSDRVQVTGEVTERDVYPLTLLGVAGLIDPLRAEAKVAVETCKRAGIRVVMVTGDHPETAFAIARQLGLAQEKSQVVSSTQLSQAPSPESPEFLRIVSAATVFAHIRPVQKLQIVEGLRRLGHFVAVTGDGVNDAPALQAANIGIAMGSGTDIARNTASIVIADDNFSSIVAGVEEGRFAYSNVRKVVHLLVAMGGAEVILFILALLNPVYIEIPLLAVQLLWLNLVTGGIQHVGLALEPGEPGALERPPIKPSESIFDPYMIQQLVVSALTVGVVAFLAWQGWLASGYSVAEARNLTLLLMVIFENLHVLVARSEFTSAFKIPFRKNIFIFGVILAAQAIHIWSLYSPFMQRILEVQPIALNEWIYCLILASSLLITTEIFKVIKRQARQREKPITA